MSSTNPTTATWIEIFPWLSSLDTPQNDFYSFEEAWSSKSPAKSIHNWNQVADVNLFDDSNFVARIADHALSECPHWAIGNLFPALPFEYKLAELRLGVRARNVLTSRNSYLYFSDLASRTIEDLFNLRNLGLGTYREIFGELARKNISFLDHDPLIDSPSPSSVYSDPRTSRLNFHDPLQEEVNKALDVLSKWSISKGDLTLGFEHIGNEKGVIPPSVENAITWLLRLRPEQWLGIDPDEFQNVSSLLDSLISALADRDQTILRERILTDSPMTLDSLGSKLNLTRERVRQLEAKILGLVRSWLDDPDLLQYHSMAVRQKIGPIAPLEVLLSAFPVLSANILEPELPAWFVFDKLDDTFESNGRWVAQPSLQKVKSDFELCFLEASTGSGFAPISLIVESLNDWFSMSAEMIIEWAVQEGFWVLEDHLVSPKIQSLQDIAFTYLSITGVPSSPSEILEGVHSTRTENSLKNALAADDRFVRSDRNEWGLEEWGAKEYAGIRDAICNLVSERGPTNLDQIIKELTENYQVSPKSIVIYANSWPLETVSGVVRLAEAPKTYRRTLSETKNLYKSANGIKFRLEITSDHMRGSGSSIPIAVANNLELAPGERVILNSREGELLFSWVGLQPAMGSIRKFLVKDDVSVGAEVMITIEGEEVDISAIHPELQETNSKKLCVLIGIEPKDEVSPSEVASALGLSPKSTWGTIIPVLNSRGEEDVLDAVQGLQGLNMSFDYLVNTSPSSKFRIVGISEA